jgi:hypothetical protein
MNSYGLMDKYANCIIKIKDCFLWTVTTLRDNKRDTWLWEKESYVKLNTYKLLKQFRKRCTTVYK